MFRLRKTTTLKSKGNKTVADFFSKLSKKEKNFFCIALVFAIVALFDRLFLGPALAKLQMLDESIASEKMSVSQDMRFLSYKGDILKKAESYSKYFVQGSSEPGVVNGEFLSTIEKLARNANVKLIKSNPLDPKHEANFSEYFTTIECSGKLEDVIGFMYAINSSEELLKVSKFSMSPKRGAENEINLSLTVVKMIISGSAAGKSMAS